MFTQCVIRNYCIVFFEENILKHSKYSNIICKCGTASSAGTSCTGPYSTRRTCSGTSRTPPPPAEGGK